jgi:hypothetical protein
MKDEHNKPKKGRGAKELLREALYAPSDELEPGGQPVSSTEDTDDVRHRLLSGFAKYLETTAGEYEGEEEKALRSALRAMRPKGSDATLSALKDDPAPSAVGRRRGARRYWTNVSVKALAGHETEGEKPVELITQKARDLIFEYVQEGGSIKPVDPFDLARYKKIGVEPREDVPDARTVHVGGRFLIQYNPTRSPARVRFSICHEITHTIFPDCAAQVRNRGTHEGMEADARQLESLCDVGAAELLMPIGSFREELEKQTLSVDALLGMKEQFKVSIEALLLRVIKLTETPCFLFSASRPDAGRPQYKVDYIFRSRTCRRFVPIGLRLPSDSVVAHCTQFGYTAKAHEIWHAPVGTLRIECVAVSPFPGSLHPRVMGIAVPAEHEAVNINSINYVHGDATKPRGGGHKIIAQIVNDKAALWGAGFALAVRRKWPDVQRNFASWAMFEPARLKLGNSHLSTVDDTTDVFHMICQRGYGDSPKPRIRYWALKTCLDRLAWLAVERDASVHMPRIGCGQAGGNWDMVSELITYLVCERGVRVTVYDLPGTVFVEKQPRLF